MEKEIKPVNNIQSVQMFRGIAAFMVVMGHSMAHDYFPREHILSKICWNGWLGVNIFFVISGFIIPYSMYQNDYRISDFRNFFVRRIVRIEPPYIISIVMVLLLNWSNTITPWYTGPAFKIDWPNVLGHLGYLNAFTHAPWLNWAYWTLAIEFQYYLIIALAFPLLVHKNKVVMRITFYAILASYFIPLPGIERMAFIPFNIYIPDTQDSTSQILLFLPFFALGIAYFLFKVQKVSANEFFLMSIAAVTVMFYRHGLIMSGIVIASLLGMHYIKKVPAAFLWLGTISYSLYLTHYVLVARFLALYLRFVSKDYIVIGWVLSVAGCLGFAYVYYLFFERPFINMAKRVAYNHRLKKQNMAKAKAIPEVEKVVAK